MSPIIVSSPICFHLNRIGNINDDISSEEQFEKFKKPGEVLFISRTVKIFEFYLVTQSL
jgi:hypothetical protein